MKLFLFLIPYIFTGVFITILGVLIERIMIIFGWTPGNTIGLAILIFIFSIFWELNKFPKTISFNVIEVLFFLLLMPITANRYDLIKTIQKGRWWWKLKNDEQNK